MKFPDKNKTIHTISFIAEGVSITGNIKTEGSIRIDGKVEGDILSAGDVVLGGHSSVHGTVHGKTVTIGGSVTGKINATEKLTLEAHAKVEGDIRTARLVVIEGASFTGTSQSAAQDV